MMGPHDTIKMLKTLFPNFAECLWSNMKVITWVNPKPLSNMLQNKSTLKIDNKFLCPTPRLVK